MHISHITNMTRIGQIIQRTDNPKKLDFKLDSNITRSELKDERGRVYAIVVDGIIEKIGGSQAKGGIKGTCDAYFGGFSKGMSERTYCIWNFMWQAIANGKLVEVYCVWAPTVTATIPTMTGTITKEIPVDFHTIEEAFVKEYVRVESKFPFLNMQESGGKWIDTGLLEGYTNKDGTMYGKGQNGQV